MLILCCLIISYIGFSIIINIWHLRGWMGGARGGPGGIVLVVTCDVEGLGLSQGDAWSGNEWSGIIKAG